MKYTETHEWIEVKEDVGMVGITDHAQRELGDIVYVELPKEGRVVNAGDEVVVLESTKAAADVYSPVSGTILEINKALTKNSELVNQSPQCSGWLFKIRLSNLKEIEKLMEENAYQKMISKV